MIGVLVATVASGPIAADARDQDGRYQATPVQDGYSGAPPYGDRRVYYERGDYGRRYRCRSNGTGGAIIGAIAGGLLGNAVAGYGDRAAGTIVGGVGGALAGRAIDRDC